MIHYDRVLDARKLSSPLPFFNTRNSVESLPPGEVIKVVASDSGAINFFQSLSRQTSVQLLLWHEQDGEYHIFVMNSY